LAGIVVLIREQGALEPSRRRRQAPEARPETPDNFAALPDAPIAATAQSAEAVSRNRPTGGPRGSLSFVAGRQQLLDHDVVSGLIPALVEEVDDVRIGEGLTRLASTPGHCLELPVGPQEVVDCQGGLMIDQMPEERLLSVGVECYAGHRGEQTPRVLILGDRRIVVAEVVDAWLAPDYRYFKLRGADGKTYLVRHDQRSDIWELTMFRAEHVTE
jgi:hypothetical protein